MNKEDGARLDNLNIIITDICDKACPACVNQGFVNKQKRFMTKEVFEKGIMWAVKNNKNGIKFNGGEPTLHPLIVDFAKLAKSHGLGTYIFTNYSNADVVKKIDDSSTMDRIIISNYEQLDLPCQSEFKTKLSLSTLLWTGRFKTKVDFDNFIDDKKNQFDKIFFETLRPATQWAINNQFIDWLEDIFYENDTEFINNKNQKIYYRGCLIKHNTGERSPYKRHNLNMDGEIHGGFEWQHDKAIKPLEIV